MLSKKFVSLAHSLLRPLPLRLSTNIFDKLAGIYGVFERFDIRTALAHLAAHEGVKFSGFENDMAVFDHYQAEYKLEYSISDLPGTLIVLKEQQDFLRRLRERGKTEIELPGHICFMRQYSRFAEEGEGGRRQIKNKVAIGDLIDTYGEVMGQFEEAARHASVVTRPAAVVPELIR